MSWLNDLYLTYEANKSEVGVIRDESPVLLPIAHSTQNAQIEIFLNQNGEFLRAEKLEKSQAVTVIPVTENSGSRSGTAAFPHSLADKLEYIAGDYGKYANKYNPEKFERYLRQLEEWAASSYAVPEIKSVLAYIQKRCMIQDLLQSELAVLENGVLSGEKVQGTAPLEWFVRFSVEIPGKAESRLYCSQEVFDSYSQYYISLQEMKGLCYATGEIVPCSEKHPAKIRNTGDKAKLISANDTSGYTYRGRLYDSRQVATVSYEVSQKAHNALRWLIAKQACLRAGEQVILVWSTANPNLKNPFEAMFFEVEEASSTDEDYAKQVRQAVWGTKEAPKPSDDVIVMEVEAATIGRLSITYYQKYNAAEFLNYIAKWKQDTRWVKKQGKDLPQAPWSPSLMEIVKQAVGDKNDKVVKDTRERILPCITEGRKFPRDIAGKVILAAINRPHYENYIEWSNAVAVACAVLRKCQIQEGKKEEVDMEWNEKDADRSELFGRLIATAEMLERYAMSGENQKTYRSTAAEKYFVRFQRYPVQTWITIRKQLQPYIGKLRSSEKKNDFYIIKLNEFEGRLDFTDTAKLGPTFLQGYSRQITEYRNHITKISNEKKEEEVYE